MTTSAQTTYNPNLTKVVNRVLRMVGAYSSTDQPRPEQVEDAVDALNMMLKSWQVDGFQWLKQYFQMPLVAGQYYYQLGPAGTAQYWPALTQTIDRPTRVWNLKRKDTAGNEVPLNVISRQEYTDLPFKTATGVVNQYYYDPQLVNGVLYVWPAPSDGVTDVIWGTCDRTLQDMIADDDTFDLPVEWCDALSYCLAERLWFEYPASAGAYQLLATRASAGKEAILDYDRENAPTYFQREYR